MTKKSLQAAAELASGISYEDSIVATRMNPSLFERVGGEEGFLKLSELFYDQVFNDTNNQWFLNIFSSSTKQEAVDNQYRFLVQTFGGNELYRQKKGKYTRLAGRHANYNISTKSATQWIKYMEKAVYAHPKLNSDEQARIHLMNYMKYTAHYIVAAREYMRPDQLSGGSQIDPEKIW